MLTSNCLFALTLNWLMIFIYEIAQSSIYCLSYRHSYWDFSIHLNDSITTELIFVALWRKLHTTWGCFSHSVLGQIMRAPIQLQCIFPSHFWPIQQAQCSWPFYHLPLNVKWMGNTAWASEVSQLFSYQTMCSMMSDLRSVQCSMAQYVAAC